jgi:hypothetical protein
MSSRSDRVLHDLQQEGHPLDAAWVAALSPYVNQHINRFGLNALDMATVPPELIYDLWA